MESRIKEKAWSKDFEKGIYEKWKASRAYIFDKNSDKPVYSIDTPPPYVNTPVHVGQASTYVMMDFFARYKRMIGYNVLFPLGLDRNGLPIEMAAERKFKKRLTEVSRKEALAMCEQVLQDSSLESTDSFLRLGISFNSWNLGNEIGDIYYTDSPEYRSLTQETFIDMWHKGLIYEDERVNNFCPGCQTTIADAEIEYRDIPSSFNHVIFRIKETGEEIIIATTRPELICTCAMVIYNPDDDRYKHLDGKTVITPLFNKEVPIKPHPIAQIDKGSGLVMMCSAGDLSDIRFFREMSLPIVIAINKDGTMNEHASILKGLKVADARKKIIELLQEKNLIVKQEKILHRTPICERSKDQIEFISMKEYYVKQLEHKDKVWEISEKTRFFEEKSRMILANWISSISIDWPISRRRYYATEIPIWYCKSCKNIYIPPKGRYYQPWKESPPIEKCPKCGSNEFIGEERVFDTWFDSSISPLYILKYSRDEKFFRDNPICSLRPQGKEIVRTWLYYTLLKCYLLTGRCIFNDVWINYHIIDDSGTKMSKSKGNIIDPKNILDKFGAEPFRFWCAVEGNLTKTDFRCSFERIDGAGKTIVKLWNLSKFISMFEQKGGYKLAELDLFIINEANSLVRLARKSYEEYDFHTPATAIRNFIWEIFASHYVELVKRRAYNESAAFSSEEQQGAIYTLHYCLDAMLRLLSPIMPMLTYYLYNELRGKDIHAECFPTAGAEYKSLFTREELMDLDSKVWKAKKDAGKALNAELASASVPNKFKDIEKDLVACHNIKSLEYSGEIVLTA